jgi:hypothetical protein
VTLDIAERYRFRLHVRSFHSCSRIASASVRFRINRSRVAASCAGLPVLFGNWPVFKRISGLETRHSQPEYQAVQDAADATFEGDPRIQHVRVFDDAYASHYVDENEYREYQNEHAATAQGAPASKTGNAGGVGRARSATRDNGDLVRARETAQHIARQRDASFAGRSDRVEQHFGRTGKGLKQFQISPAFGGFRATGGDVKSDQSYIVGEDGPEIFSAGSRGVL